ncbi:MAG: hypothetical protein Ta2A_16560 [Treponemataceae bacterium]|nr:MAG: hypothetical protein Ta2A_16560 [Treponemataceae bacterium]
MLQIYFLSVLLTVYSGLAIVFEEKSALFANKPFRLLLGLGAFVVGVLLIFPGFQTVLPNKGGLFLIGDLIPAAAAICAGFTLLLDFYSSTSSIGTANLPETLTAIFVHAKRYLGIICIIVAVIHFLFPTAVFL